METSKIILEQLGGGKFIAMTGAKNFVGGNNALTFRLPSNFAKGGINAVRVTLGGDDLYTLEFMKIRGVQVTPVSKYDAVYCDMLQPLFTQNTGLDTRL